MAAFTNATQPASRRNLVATGATSSMAPDGASKEMAWAWIGEPERLSPSTRIWATGSGGRGSPGG